MRLIDADALKRECEKLPRVLDDEFIRFVKVKDITKTINNAPTVEAEPVRSGRRGMCKTHDNGYGRINLYSGGGWQTAICKGVENYEMVISHNGDHFATRIEYCPYCGERLDVK